MTNPISFNILDSDYDEEYIHYLLECVLNHSNYIVAEFFKSEFPEVMEMLEVLSINRLVIQHPINWAAFENTILDWIRYITIDGDGDMYGFSHRPIYSGERWRANPEEEGVRSINLKSVWGSWPHGSLAHPETLIFERP